MVAPCLFILVLNAFRREEVVSVLILPAPAASSGKGKAREISASRRPPTPFSSSPYVCLHGRKGQIFCSMGKGQRPRRPGRPCQKLQQRSVRFSTSERGHAQWYGYESISQERLCMSDNRMGGVFHAKGNFSQ